MRPLVSPPRPSSARPFALPPPSDSTADGGDDATVVVVDRGGGATTPAAKQADGRRARECGGGTRTARRACRRSPRTGSPADDDDAKRIPRHIHVHPLHRLIGRSKDRGLVRKEGKSFSFLHCECQMHRQKENFHLLLPHFAQREGPTHPPPQPPTSSSSPSRRATSDAAHIR